MGNNLHPTSYRFRHYSAPVHGERTLLWGSGLGELSVPENTQEHSRLLGVQAFEDNAVGDDGEKAILEAYFRGGAVPTAFYGALYNDTPIETDTLATLVSEVTGTGYARQLIENTAVGWPTSALAAGDWQINSKTITFTNTGGTWTAATYFVLATVVSGTAGILVAYEALSVTRTLGASETLDVDIKIKLA